MTAPLPVPRALPTRDWFVVEDWSEVYARTGIAPRTLPGVRTAADHPVADLAPRTDPAFAKQAGASARSPYPHVVHRSHLPVLGFPTPPVFPLVVSVRQPILRVYQEEGARFIRERHGALLSDECRVGKTCQVMYAHDPDTGPLVVVGPVAARAAWHEWAARRFGTCFEDSCPICARYDDGHVSDRPSFVNLTGRAPDLDRLRGGAAASVYFLTYAVIGPWSEQFTAFGQIGTLIADEAHLAGVCARRNVTAVAMKRLSTVAERVVYASVSGDAVVTLRNKARDIIVCTMREAARMFGVHDEGTTPVEGYETRSFDERTGQMCWAPVYGLQAHRASDPLIELCAQAGTRLRVTAGHSVYTISDGKIKQPRAADIRVGELLIRDAEVDTVDDQAEIDLTAYLRRSCFYVHGAFAPSVFDDLDQANLRPWSVSNWRRGGCLPIDVWHAVGRPEGAQRIQSARSAHSATVRVPTSAIAYLVGLVAGDGWVSDRRIGIAVANQDVRFVVSYLETLRPWLDFYYSIKDLRGCVQLRISCDPLVELFANWFHQGERAPAKRLPIEVFRWPRSAREAVIRGLVDSDGYVSKPTPGHPSLRVIVTSTSRMLLADLRVLLLTVGEESAIHEQTVRVDPRPAFANTKRAYRLTFQQQRTNRSHAVANLQGSRVEIIGANAVRVQGAREVEPPGASVVYDFAVRGTENFVADGVVCHNSGSPLWNKPAGLWPIVDTICPAAFGDYWNFCRRHADAKPGAHGWSAKGSTNEEELRKRLSAIMLRRTWREIQADLPPITRAIEYVDLSPSDHAAVYEAVADLRKAVGAGKAQTVVGNLERLRKVYASYKIARAVEIIGQTLADGHSVIAWCWHRDVADALAARLREVRPYVVHGKTPPAARDVVLDEARTASTFRPLVFIATIGALGTGCSLNFASHEVFVELDWTPANIAQAEMRPFDGTRPISSTFIVADCDPDRRQAAAIFDKLQVAAGLGLARDVGVADLLRSAFGDAGVGKTLDDVAALIIEGERA